MLDYIYSKFYMSFVLKLLLLFFDFRVPIEGEEGYWKLTGVSWIIHVTTHLL
jgi:hypothetical protein